MNLNATLSVLPVASIDCGTDATWRKPALTLPQTGPRTEPPAAPPVAPRVPAGRSRTKRILGWIALGLAAVLVVTVTGGYLVYRHLNGNITH